MYCRRNESLESLDWVGAVIGIGTAAYGWYTGKMKKRRAEENQIRMGENLVIAKTALEKAKATALQVQEQQEQILLEKQKKATIELMKKEKKEAELLRIKIKETYIPIGVAILAGGIFVYIIKRKLKGKK